MSSYTVTANTANSDAIWRGLLGWNQGSRSLSKKRVDSAWLMERRKRKIRSWALHVIYTEEKGQKVRQRKIESHYSTKTVTGPLEMTIMFLGYITESCRTDNDVNWASSKCFNKTTTTTKTLQLNSNQSPLYSFLSCMFTLNSWGSLCWKWHP